MQREKTAIDTDTPDCHAHYQTPPFSVRPLRAVKKDEADASTLDDTNPLLLLPASFRTSSDDLACPALNVAAFLAKELDLRRLSVIHDLLWLVGRPMPPRPLHYQVMLNREIVITERMDMHLVWTTGRIHLKPIPRFLLAPQFWTDHLSPSLNANDTASRHVDGLAQHDTRLRRCALGFLFSYAALISHESDFAIAKKNSLLPDEVTWPDWRLLVEQLGTEHIYRDVVPRFRYGELRLSRLNKIYYLWQTPLRGYASSWNQYGSFLADNFAYIAGATVYIAVVLTAMQVGLATEALAGNSAFQRASSGFTIFSILGPLVAAALILLALCCLCVENWVVTIAYRNRRLRKIGRPATQTERRTV